MAQTLEPDRAVVHQGARALVSLVALALNPRVLPYLSLPLCAGVACHSAIEGCTGGGQTAGMHAFLQERRPYTHYRLIITD